MRKKENFIESAKIIHKEKYSYDKVIYTNNREKVIITCPVHGDFLQVPFSHIEGHGCKKCRSESLPKKYIKSINDFIIKAQQVHDNKYDYSKSIYNGSKNNLTITCSIHGDFLQKPENHLQGYGCNQCRLEHTGWNLSKWKEAGESSKKFIGFFVYIIKCYNDYETFYKIGRSFRKLEYRFSGKLLPYNFEIIKLFNGNAEEMFKLEIELKRKNKSNKYIPELIFSGRYECFSIVDYELHSN